MIPIPGLVINILAAAVSFQCNENCELRRVHVATLEQPADSVQLGDVWRPHMLTSGGFIVIPHSGARIVEFAADGRFLRAAKHEGTGFGKLGSGAKHHLVGPGDTVVVQQRGRIDLFSPQLAYSRSLNDTAVNAILTLVLQNGEFVFHSQHGETNRFLHVSSPDGQRRLSFGDEQIQDAACVLCRVRIMTQGSAANEFLAINPRVYTIERWSSDGKLRQRFPTGSAWFTTTAVVRDSASGRTAPPPSLTGISRDESGNILVAGMVSNPRWKPSDIKGAAVLGNGRLVQVGGTGGSVTGSIAGMPVRDVRPPNTSYMHDTFVDAIDAVNGRVLATGQFTGEVIYLLPRGYAYTTREDSNRRTVIDVWKFELVRRILPRAPIPVP